MVKKATIYTKTAYKKDNHGKPVRNYIRKDLDFLWKTIVFNRPQLDLVRNRDYTIKDDIRLHSIQSMGVLLDD